MADKIMGLKVMQGANFGNEYPIGADASNVDITVNGTATVTVKSGNIPTSPTFYVFDSENLAVVYNDRSYPLPKNSVKAYEVYRFPQIKVADEDVTLTFTGKGKVSVEYRGRFL